MSTVIAEMLDLPTAAVLNPLKLSLKTSSTPEITEVKRLDQGKGYLSMIAQLKLKWSGGTDSGNLPSSVVVKMPTTHKLDKSAEGIKADEKKGGKEESESNQPQFETYLLPVHNVECKFFNQFGPSLTGKLFVPLPQVFHTKCFDCTTELRPGDYGLIVMGDLVGKGRTPDYSSEVLTDGQVETLINCIASLHAYCIINPDWNKEGVYQPTTAYIRADLAATVKGSLTAFRSEYPADFTASDEDISKIADANVIRHVYSKNPADIDYFPVLVHGDLWMNNAIFDVQNGNLSDSLVAILDWQTVQPGPVTDDFTFLTATSVDSDVRRANTHRWLKIYYQLLGEKLPKDQQIPFSFDEVVRMHKRTFRIATLTMAILLPYMLNDPLSADKYNRQQRGTLVRRLQKNIDDTLKSYAD